MQTNKLLAKLLVNSKSIDGMRKLTTSSIYIPSYETINEPTTEISIGTVNAHTSNETIFSQ